MRSYPYLFVVATQSAGHSPATWLGATLWVSGRQGRGDFAARSKLAPGASLRDASGDAHPELDESQFVRRRRSGSRNQCANLPAQKRKRHACKLRSGPTLLHAHASMSLFVCRTQPLEALSPAHATVSQAALVGTTFMLAILGEPVHAARRHLLLPQLVDPANNGPLRSRHRHVLHHRLLDEVSLVLKDRGNQRVHYRSTHHRVPVHVPMGCLRFCGSIALASDDWLKGYENSQVAACHTLTSTSRTRFWQVRQPEACHPCACQLLHLVALGGLLM